MSGFPVPHNAEQISDLQGSRMEIFVKSFVVTFCMSAT